jgi:glycosyltransferase involved in cell wall biosynthesis
VRRRAAVALVPSRWEEPCPYSVLESLAAGVPVLASSRGGLPEMVGDAAALTATDPAAWRAALSELWQNPRLRAQRGEDAIAWARDRYGEERYYEQLTRLYDGVSP